MSGSRNPAKYESKSFQKTEKPERATTNTPQKAAVLLREPVSTRALSTREKIILLEGSKLNGSRFPPWETAPKASDFDLEDNEPLFSEQQLKTSDTTGPVMVPRGKVDLIQDVTSDCSVVASLCAGTARAERGYPTHPALSTSGKYIFRLYFNGCWRRVVIDDQLPASIGPRTLHVLDRNNPTLLWPALVEKAYLKVRGGYDFPGSNSASDLWVLTGWIPEQVFLQSEDVGQEALWNRILRAFAYGDIFITLGTGSLTEIEEKATGLASEHDYAVINLEEHNGKRELLVKNPWSEGSVWAYSAEHSKGVEPPSHNANGLCQEPVDGLKLNERQSNLEPGTFWMSLRDVLQHFNSLYLNWNPGLFSYREDVHFSWDLTRTVGPRASFGSNPQYHICSKTGGTLWLVLNRHFKSVHTNEGSAIHDEKVANDSEIGFISLHLYQNRGNKVYLTRDPLVRGPYVDSQNALLKVELRKNVPYTLVVSQQELHRSCYSFTLSFFSLNAISFSEAQDKYSVRKICKGTWTSTTSGGNASSPSYSKNPQFSLDLPQSSDVSLLLELHSTDFPVHVRLMWTEGKSIGSVASRNIVGDSGEYRKGHAFAEVFQVPAGRYTAICSTFEEGQLGDFTLQIGAMAECQVDRISTHPAGQFTSMTPLVAFGAGVECMRATLQCSRLSRISVHARSYMAVDRSKPSNLPLKLWVEHGQGLMRRVLAISADDEFSNGHYGTHVDEVDIQPLMCTRGGIWLVLERAGPLETPSQDVVEVAVYSDTKVEVGLWKASS
ncbi:MAG: hypothetical protein Q9222_000846 [Ikaeria aurantiellina]